MTEAFRQEGGFKNCLEEEDVVHFAWKEKLTVVDYEKELMRKRAQLLYKLKHPVIYQEFMEFMSFSKSRTFVLILNCLYTLLFLPTVLANLILGSRDMVVLSGLETFLTISMTLAGWLLYGCMREGSLVQSNGRFLLALTKTKSWKEVSDQVQCVLYLLLVSSMGLVMTRRTWTGDCSHGGYWYSWTCNSSSSNNLPLDSTVILMFIPLFFSCVMRETRVVLTLLAWSITMFCLIFSCFLVKSTNAFVTVIFYGIVSVIIMFDSYKQYLLLYLLSRQLKKTIETNQRLAEQNKADDLRHMIANVAHDLKTPLSSFMTGIDLIAADLADFNHKLSSFLSPQKEANDPATSSISSFISAVQANITNIRNTNSFMLMTINRCLDYTKASNGLKLVPKNETIELTETLIMPLSCMSNIQQKIKISLIPFHDQEICSHIITDKQWLQENVLCLLSNAVKFSAGGEVLIKVTKLSHEESSKLRKKENNLFSQNHTGPSHCDEVKDIECGMKQACKRQASANARHLNKVVPVANDDLSETVASEMPPERFIHEEVMVEVVDAGIGLSEEAMKSLFNPFSQTQRLAGGTGLGLYSLAKRIEALQGVYGVRQRVDGKQGSVFWFTIPYKPDKFTAMHYFPSKDEIPIRDRLNSENSTSIVDVKSPPSQSSASKKIIEKSEKLCILLAEDTPSIAKMTTLLLRRQRHETAVAENGQIALDMLYKSDDAGGVKGEGRYDVVLMDLQMPVMDGLEATRRIRAHERELFSKNGFSHNRQRMRQVVIGVSANSDYETMEEAFEAGVDDFLPKPFSVDAFITAVRKAQLKSEEVTYQL